MRLSAVNPDAVPAGHWVQIRRLVPSFGLAQALQALTGFLVAWFLLPAQYGLWSLFAVVLFYCAQLHVGSINLMHKEVPFFLAAKDDKAAEQVTNFAFSVSATNCIIAACVTGVVALAWHIPGVTTTEIGLLAAVIVSQELFIFVNYWLRAHQRFSALSRYLTLYACCSLALVASLAWQERLTGVLLGYLLSGSGVALYFIFEQKIHLGYALRGVSWKKLQNAFHLLLWTMMFVFLTTMDRVFISWKMGMVALGLFGVSLLVSSLVYNTADAVLQVLFPAASSLVAGSRPPNEVARLLLNAARTLSYGMAAVLGLGFLVLPPIVTIILPRYSGGIPAARIICLGLGPLVLAQLISVNLVVMGRVLHCLLLQGSVLAVKLLSLVALRHPQLADVALISSLTNGLYLLMMLAAVVPASFHAFVKILAGIVAPWFVVAIILLIVSAARSNTTGLGALLPLALYLVLALPVLWMAHQRTRGVAHV